MSNITPATSDNPLIKIIVADNDIEMRTLLKLILERAGYQYNLTQDYQEVLSSLKNGVIDLLLGERTWLDNWPWNHKESFLEAEQYLYNVGVIEYSARTGVPSSSNKFTDVIVSKPFDINHLLHKIQDVLRKYGKLPPS